MLDLKEQINKLEHNKLSIDESFQLGILVNDLINNDDLKGYKLVVNVLNQWCNIPEQTHELWTDLIELAGFYPYMEKNKSKLIVNNLSAEIRKGLHLSSHLQNKFFHEEQLNALKILQEGKNLILSAPTSFGKSLLIEEVVASNKYINIVIIQPTLALLDETRQKLNQYNNEYNLVIRTSQEPSTNKKNIFLFTAERVNEYQYFKNVDFLIIDEFYKLSGHRDDERSAFLNNALYNLHKKYKPQFYLLGPNIDGISDGFANKYNATFYRTEYSLVDNRVINIYEKHKENFGPKGEKKTYKENILFELLLELKNEQTIIYCSSPARVRYLSKKFIEFQTGEKKKNTIEFPLVEWIQKNISLNWELIDNLKQGIGIHDGGLPKHVTSTIIDYFNTGLLKYLFCTSTIIEGVNTRTKNIVFFDSKKGNVEVDFFDYANIKGRAGRMMVHYIGYIYNFNPPPPKINNYVVDIPFYQQNPIKDETLIQLDKTDVKDKSSLQYIEIEKINSKDKDVIKDNGINVKGQVAILSILRGESIKKHTLISWSQYPSYEQLKYILDLAWDNLIVDGETTSPMTKKWLVQFVFNYGIKKNLQLMITDRYKYKKKVLEEKNKDLHLKGKKLRIIDKSKLENEAIQEIMQMFKHWIQYKVPKWLAVINSLQELVCSELGIPSGNYSHYASSLENEFLPNNLTILLEYGIPASAIHKLEKEFTPEVSQDEILSIIKKKQLYKSESLLSYEQYKLKKLFNE